MVSPTQLLLWPTWKSSQPAVWPVRPIWCFMLWLSDDEHPSWPSALRCYISLYGCVKLSCHGCLPGHMPIAWSFNHKSFTVYHILSHHIQGHRCVSWRPRRDGIEQNSTKVKFLDHMTPWGCLDTSRLSLVPPHSSLCQVDGIPLGRKHRMECFSLSGRLQPTWGKDVLLSRGRVGVLVLLKGVFYKGWGLKQVGGGLGI